MLKTVKDKNYNPWTQKEVELLRKYIDEGFHEYVKINSLGLGKKTKMRWSEDDRNFIISQLEKGTGIEKIATSLGRGVFAVIKRCKMWGIKNKYKQIKEFLGKDGIKDLEFVENVFTERLRRAKNHAKDRGIKFYLTVDNAIKLWIKQNGLCFYTKLKMSLKSGDENVVSLERLDSNKDYTKDNVVLCLRIINEMKQDMEMSKFYYYCNLIIKNRKNVKK